MISCLFSSLADFTVFEVSSNSTGPSTSVGFEEMQFFVGSSFLYSICHYLNVKRPCEVKLILTDYRWKYMENSDSETENISEFIRVNQEGSRRSGAK